MAKLGDYLRYLQWMTEPFGQEQVEEQMTTRDDWGWMWVDACALLDRAEGLQRQFFQPRPGRRQPVWEPPVDVFESQQTLWLIIALPGVTTEQVELIIDDGTLIVTGKRTLPAQVRHAEIRRLEIPAGRFERRIALPAGRFELCERSLANGCLLVGLSKLQGDRP